MTQPAPTFSKSGITPPKSVQAACRRGLDLAPEHGGDGLTDAAKQRARQMAAGQAVSPDTLKRIKAFHARHTYEKTANPPSPGYVAFMIWGGDAGKRWANTEVDRMDKSLDPDRPVPDAPADDEEEKKPRRPAAQPDGKPDLMKKPNPSVAKASKQRGKNKLVGGNKGAWATAKDKAKGKRDPEAYARAIYVNMTKKTKEIAKASRDILQNYISK